MKKLLPIVKSLRAVVAFFVMSVLCTPATAQVATFNTAGATTWICPAGVTTVTVECWGGGGGGGGSTGANATGGGGGGGAYTKNTAVSVLGGTTYNLVVGAGGAGGSAAGVAGVASTFGTSTVTANGGGAGGAGTAVTAGTSGTGGAAGTHAGGNGTAGVTVLYSGAGGGGAGSGGAGVNASTSTAGAGGAPDGGIGGAGITGNGNGNPGTTIGGGGSGAKSNGGGAAKTGGSGATGYVRITWTLCSAPTAQPGSLVLTPAATSISGSFAASSPASNGYLVIRTTSSTAPSLPVNGTTYTVGSSALGGFIENNGSSTSFTTFSALTPNTHYWFWVYSINYTNCAGGPLYLTTSPLSGNAYTNCASPTNQPTSLILTPGVVSIAASFTASSPAANGYLVIRTATSTAPANPANGTSYTAGTSALGGYIESFGTAVTFASSSLTANTPYWYWIFAYTITGCTNGASYNTVSPLSGNVYTNCTSPAAQPTSLILTPGSNSIGGSFTASSPAANGYLVVRTATSTAPTNPSNGTSYSAGTSALGGYIESSGATITFSSSLLTANTHYWYWIFAYTITGCTNGAAYNTVSPLTGNAYTNCASPTNQPTSLILTPGVTGIGAAFTASSPAADGYLVVRTATSTAPTNPSNGTSYAAGASALGGYIESSGSSLTFSSSSLTANTRYWYWIFAYNITGCTNGASYNSVSPLSGNAYTNCASPTGQPTSLILTPGASTIGGSFTASSPAANSYLVIRTTTASAPTNPSNGISYTAGTVALGGYIESAGASLTFSSTSLTANTQYWYWIFSYTNTACTNGAAYNIVSPLSGNAYTCTPPTAQATALSLTLYANNIDGSFSASATATNYLVIRTGTSTAPSSPIDGTTYTSGTTALGGYVESAGTSLTWKSILLTASTQYWYWVYGYNISTCGTRYLATSPLAGNGTTVACGSQTNTATIITAGSATYQWNVLTWSLGHLPTACENAQIVLNSAGAADDAISVNLNVDTTVYSFKMSNISPGPYVHVFNTQGNVNLVSLHDFTVDAPGGTKYNRSAFANIKSTTIYGNLYLGRVAGTAAEGMGAIGSTGNTPGQLYTIYGDMYFYPRGYTTDEHAIFVFDKAGTQHIYNYTLATDTVQPVLFEDIRAGNVNATTLIFGGTVYDGYMESVGRAGLQIGINSVVDLPANFSFNVLSPGSPGYLKMLAGSKLRLGGDRSITGSFGITGSNFPIGYSPYTLDATSTIEYYGGSGITQTIYNGITYQNLDITNGPATGRAPKITTGGVTVTGVTNVKALADLSLGSVWANTGAMNVLSTGALYCATNVVSGAGAFTLNSGGILGMGHLQGITAGAFATGNIQMTGGRSFSTGGNYIYNGTGAQITGNGLPTTCNDLTIDNPTMVTIANSQTVTGINKLSQGVFDIGTNNKIAITGTGTLTSVTGKMKANLGMLELNGSSGTAQSLDGSWFVNRNISTLINSNNTGITVASTANDTLLISSALLYGSSGAGAITTNGNLTLMSRDTATARFGQMAGSNSITGNVNVERWIGTFGGRKWRHLAWPTTSTQTARQSWMENNATANGNLTPGYGTIVTDNLSTWSTNNFDSKSVSGPSVKYYNPATNNYTGIPNTTVYNMNSQSAYFNFVRGDRSCTPANSTLAATILRTTGTLKTGNQVFSVTTGKYAAIGNPYASAIDIRNVDTLNLTSTFQVWDPKLTGQYGLGAYQTLYASGGGYKVMPGGGSYGALNSAADTIESGQAFFVKARTGVTGTVTVKETSKQLSARTMQRDGSPNPVVPGVYPLLSLSNLGSAELLDGCMANFDPSYSSGIDDWDIPKIANTSENVSLSRNGQLFSIERRKNITTDDTLFVNVTGYRVHQYRWDITVDKLDDDPSRHGYLIDNFLGTSTELTLDGVNTMIFSVDGSAGSNAATRFMIVFKQPAAILPVRFTTISATRNNDKTVTVKWATENEINMQNYKVEHSDDGIRFTDIGTQLPSAVSGGSAAYSLIDTHATSGFNYYRVRGNSLNGQQQYTAIVKVGPIGKGSPAMGIYPNPVTEGNVNLHFENQPKGTYSVTVTNKIGQVMHTETLEADNDNFVLTISLGTKAAPEATRPRSQISQGK